MSVGIIIKGKTNPKNPLEHLSKDQLHRRRKELESTMREGVFNKDQMNWRDCKSKDDEEKRVKDYDKWKVTKTSTGLNNAQNMRAWSDINLEFKRRKEEGKPQCIDFVRQRKSTKYE